MMIFGLFGELMIYQWQTINIYTYSHNIPLWPVYISSSSRALNPHSIYLLGGTSWHFLSMSNCLYCLFNMILILILKVDVNIKYLNRYLNIACHISNTKWTSFMSWSLVGLCWACPYMKIEMKSVSTSDINVLFIDECILRISQISTNKQSLNILFKNLHVNVSIFIFMTQYYFILSRWTELTELDIRHTMQVSFTFSKINILFWPYLFSFSAWSTNVFHCIFAPTCLQIKLNHILLSPTAAWAGHCKPGHRDSSANWK